MKLKKKISEVIVVGAGSAGLLAALALKIKIPELKVSVVRSHEIPIIGVGEGTTIVLPFFLKEYLKLNQSELYHLAEPVWKLGIKFDWGQPNNTFNYTFDKALEAKSSNLNKNNAFYYFKNLRHGSISDWLMDTNKSPLFRVTANSFEMNNSQLGYHIENSKFVTYLEKKVREVGVEIIDQTIESVKKDRATGRINKLLLKDGTELTADLFIDSSGFESLLLGKTLKEKFINFESSLPCDTAVTGNWLREEDEPILPYTTAETMNNGWCWRIDLKDRINRGYVFSSKFCSAEEAIREMKAKNPKMGDKHRIVKFITGRYKNFWAKNVVAIGNAGGFVEPLEATGLHMICESIRRLIEALLDSDLKPTESLKQKTNEIITAIWDDIRWFLALHYKFNKKLDTPFWQHCNKEIDVSGVKELLDFYEENGPSVFNYRLISPYSMFGYDGYMTMLVMQKAPTKYEFDLSDDEKVKWENTSKSLKKFVEERYLSMKEAFTLLEKSQIQA